jgi:hypothetical protein
MEQKEKKGKVAEKVVPADMEEEFYVFPLLKMEQNLTLILMDNKVE